MKYIHYLFYNVITSKVIYILGDVISVFIASCRVKGHPNDYPMLRMILERYYPTSIVPCNINMQRSIDSAVTFDRTRRDQNRIGVI